MVEMITLFTLSEKDGIDDIISESMDEFDLIIANNASI
ncbi:hypothetical protein ECIG_05543 [Escherichia coli M605]|uniref:Uncharacterized protein n=1 Tax=Escherichia coli M605 TaxID=656417 RepID=F4T8V5_ECOLX|nr:hypothetical protein ECIG_05543 [Escherichia coli M605]